MHREADSAHGPTVEQAILDVDTLLDRFRALLRISELEDMHRRAGFTEVNLVKTIDHVREIYTPLAEDKHITFSFEIAPYIPTVRGDPHLLLEAVSNIVDNAIKFTPAGGSIRLRLIKDAGAGARIDVIDSGPGIPPEQRERVFDRFYRVDGDRHEAGVAGCGLGLSIVQQVANLHGARIELRDSVFPSGLWVRIAFPRSRHATH